MSTAIYEGEFYTDIYTKEVLMKAIKEECESVEKQIKEGKEIIEFRIGSIELCFDYETKNIYVIV